MPFKDPVKKKESEVKYYKDLTQHAMNSIKIGEIIDQHKWNVWCNTIKRRAKKYPYSDEFTNVVMFEMMIQGCFYCEDIATTIDRVDSKFPHTPDNCVASCWECNNSKGTADSSTFIRKAYYRARGNYFDDITDIWFVYKKKPSMSQYKQNSDKKGVPFDLTKTDWDTMIHGGCVYCHRPSDTWFGIDRIVPSSGYVLGNTVSCCFDCNLDKYERDVDTMMKRNERIADRVDDGVLVIKKCDKVTLHQGIQKSSNKVCVFGIVYSSKSEASRALGKCDSYISKCIKEGWHPGDIFEIDEFYT